MPALRFMRLFAVVFESAKFNARLSLCFRAWNPAAFKIVRAMLNMGPQFFVEFIPHCRTVHKGGPTGPHCVEDSHSSSGCAESALPMAAASRFQLSVSSCSRFLPAAVSS